METKDSEDELGPGKREENLSPERRFKRLVTRCLKAMNLCLQRFPQHYKSLYRIAHWSLTARTDQNLQWCYDLLLGSTLPWQQMPHMPAPALFGEHSKTKNIFQGIWRIPIADIDRSGSFSWHMYRSVTLLIRVLEAMKDESMLLELATKLARTPEQGKKFLRDSDRPHLALRAFHTCQTLLATAAALGSSSSENSKLTLLMQIWHTLHIGQQLPISTDNDIANKALVVVYKSLKDVKIADDPPAHMIPLFGYCQHLISDTSGLSQTPYQIDFTKIGRSSYLGSPGRAPGDRPQSSQFPERLDQIRSPGSLGLGPSNQPKKSSDASLGSSFMMSNILAPDPERKINTQGRVGLAPSEKREGSQKIGPSLAEAGISVNRMTKSPVTSPSESWIDVRHQARGRAQSEVNKGDERSRDEMVKDGNEGARLDMAVKVGSRLSSPHSLLPSDKGSKEVLKYSDTCHGLETGVKVGGLASPPDTGEGGPDIPQKMWENLSKTGQVEGRPLEMKTLTKSQPTKGEPEPVKGSVHSHGHPNITGSVKAPAISGDVSLSQGGKVPPTERVQSPPALPPAPRPDLGQHLNSLLMKVRTGLKVTDKSRWKKLTLSPGHSGSQPVVARVIAHQSELGEKRIRPAKMPSLIDVSSEVRSLKTGVGKDKLTSVHLSGGNVNKSSGMRGKLSAKEEATTGLHYAQSLASDQHGSCGGAAKTSGQIESTDGEKTLPLMSDASEKERARFDAILNSLKTSEGTVGGSSEGGKRKNVTETSAVGGLVRRPDALADILDSLKRQDSKTSEQSMPKGMPSEVQRSSSGDSRHLSSRSEQGSAEHPPLSKITPDASSEDGTSNSEKRNASLKRQRSEGESISPEGLSEPFSPTTISLGLIDQRSSSRDTSTDTKRSKTSGNDPSLPEEARSSAELAKILGSLKRPKHQVSGERRHLSASILRKAESDKGATGKGKTLSKRPSVDTAKKRSLSYVDIFNSLKRRKIERSDKGKDLSGRVDKGQSKRFSSEQSDVETTSGSKVDVKLRPFDRAGPSSDQGLGKIPPAPSKAWSKPVEQSDTLGISQGLQNIPKKESKGNGDKIEGEGKKGLNEIPLSELKYFSPTDTVCPVEYLTPKKMESSGRGEKVKKVGKKNFDEIPLLKLRLGQGLPSDNIQLDRADCSSNQGLQQIPQAPSKPLPKPVEQSDTLGDYQGPQKGSLEDNQGLKNVSEERKCSGSGESIEGDSKKGLDEIPSSELKQFAPTVYPVQCSTPKKVGDGKGDCTHESPSDNIPLSKLAEIPNHPADEINFI